jgi:hypothetical protein
MVLVDWSEYFNGCAGGTVDGGGGLKGAYVGAAQDDVEIGADKPLTRGFGLAPPKRSEFTVDWRAGDSGVGFRLSVTDEVDPHHDNSKVNIID